MAKTYDVYTVEELQEKNVEYIESFWLKDFIKLASIWELIPKNLGCLIIKYNEGLYSLALPFIMGINFRKKRGI